MRTVTGRYILRVQLHRKDGSDFHGVPVDAQRPLPIPWARRAIRPRERIPDVRPEDRRSGDWRFFRDTDAEIIEAMRYSVTGEIQTAHTTNPVPLVIAGATGGIRLHKGGLADLAPTLLDLLHLEQPAEMTGHSLVEGPGLRGAS